METNQHFSTQHRKFKKTALRLMAGVTFVLLLPQVNAAEIAKEAEVAKETTSAKEAAFTKEITVAAGVEHDSNPNMVKRNQEPVWIYTIAPQLHLGASNEANLWYLDAGLLVQRPSNEKVLTNREDPRLAVGWDRTYESGLFGIKADYLETSSRAAELKSTGVFSKADNTERIRILSARWLHAIDPRWSVLTEGAYNNITFSLPGSFQNYKLEDIRSKLSYANSEKLNTNIQLSYSHLRPDSNLDNTSLVRLVMGADYQVNEGFKIAPRAGIYNLSGRQSDTDWEAGIKAEYTAERMNYRAEVSRDLTVSGVGGFQKSDSFILGWLFNINERDRLGAEYGLNKSKKDREVNLNSLDYQQVSAFYERNLSNYWKTRFSAAYKEQDVSGTRSQGNVIGVSLTYDTLSF
ncbi:MAG: hypothetical protein WBL28_11235 [Methylotenera sp.]